MPLEPLNFPILEKVVPPTLLCNQTSIRYQLSHPHCGHPEDLSGLFRSDQAHLATLSKPRHGTDQLQSTPLVAQAPPPPYFCSLLPCQDNSTIQHATEVPICFLNGNPYSPHMLAWLSL